MTYPLRPVKWYKKLTSKKGRLEAGFFLVEGEQAVRQIAAVRPEAIDEVVAVEGLGGLDGYPLRVVTESQFLDISSTRTPQGILAVVRLPMETYSDILPREPGRRILLLEDIQDPGNVGTLIRSAAAFDFSGILMTEKCADPFSPKCAQSAAGSMLSVWMRRTEEYLSLASRFKEMGYSLVATGPGGVEPASVLPADRIVIALGNEGTGLSEAVLRLSSQRFWIPISREKAESLNVAISGAICMFLSVQR